jgi:multidrug efflux pump subunit AcrA (membrane-fusion protein)
MTMKTKGILLVVIVLAIGAGAYWLQTHPPFKPVASAADGRKVLYYTCSMHPWVHESQPGACPVCGMNLTPVYVSGGADASPTNADAKSGIVTLEPDSISTINVQTDTVERQPVRRSIHFSGEISYNSAQSAWFEFIAYQRDLPWLKLDQTLEVSVTGITDKTFTAKIRMHGVKPFADNDFNMMTSSTTLRAEISNAPVVLGDLGKYKHFNGLHAEAHLVAETEPVLCIPRSAIVSRGLGALVYVDQGRGHYAPRTVELGRIGDHVTEVVSGLNAGDKIVTNGNILIDSEAQLVAGH